MEEKQGNASPRPGENWTGAQWQAIISREKNVLVSAAAGAGKTRVLVERVLRQITDPADPAEIDQLLIVTFTNAAAQEMKQRIGVALEKEIKANPRSTQLRRQLLMLNRATIATVHSFCMDVLRRYYYLHELDPSFRVLDETEAELLQQEILEEVLEDFYAEAAEGSPFYTLVDAYTSDRGDQELLALVRRLYDFSRSHPWPDNWLAKMASAFTLESKGELAETSWVKLLQESCLLELEGIAHRLEEGIRLCIEPGGPEPYYENLLADREGLQAIRDACRENWFALYEAVHGFTFGRLNPCRGDEYDPFLKDRVSRLRKECKDDFARLRQELFERSLEEQAEELQKIAPVMEVLVELVQSFAARYRQAKKEKSAVDFADLEHFTLQILAQPGSAPGELLPSTAAQEYRRRFAEVLIDEYQDINAVQEAILRLVSCPEPAGNLFMVGDVKQSIYRFRLAEPGLFLQKYRDYSADSSRGKCIDLSFNFRSRASILAGVNFLFRQLMDDAVGEIDYDHRAELLYGGLYPSDTPAGIDLYCIERGSGSEEDAGEEDREAEWDSASLEGRLIVQKIRELRGEGGKEPFQVYDKKRETFRPVMYRDMVVLLRSAQNWAPAIMEELRQAGIPAYAELGTGYFAATEVEVMLSLLKVIDNPYQDIPLAAVLRSPVVGFSAEELANLRLAAPRKSYYDALQAACTQESVSFAARLQAFREKLLGWQEAARQGALADLIWQVYRDTGYYDLVGGMPGGNQRQANLRALYDRARQYEATSFRGLFRFLRFVERLRDKGGDLGTARALGEQEDVVRVLTIHKSKGLEFPVVFVAGLSKQFNMQDLHNDFLLHRDLGFGPKFIDTRLRLVYPTLPWMAVKKRQQLEMLAEEMRILYVAMTRAEEKLYLMGTTRDLSSRIRRWAEAGIKTGGGMERNKLPLHYRMRSKSFLDWIGAALLRHPGGDILREKGGVPSPPEFPAGEDEELAAWNVTVLPAGKLLPKEEDENQERREAEEKRWAPVASLEPVSISGGWFDEVNRRLSWTYTYPQSTEHFAKVSVSELKSRQPAFHAGGESEMADPVDPPVHIKYAALPRPRFMEEGELSAAERGTAYHVVMQNLSLQAPLDEDTITGQIERMLHSELLSPEQKEAVDAGLVARFFRTPVGQRLLKAREVYRELPFSMVLPAAEVYPQWVEGEEKVLVQGVIDCLWRDDGGLALIDYKSGRVPDQRVQRELLDNYSRQLALYALAVERIWKEKVKERYLFFFADEALVDVT